jgi:hypothetical protein
VALLSLEKFGNFLHGSAAAASLGRSENAGLSGYVKTQGLSHGGGAFIEEDLDAHLLETGQGPGAHTTGDQCFSAGLFQEHDRSHAAPLDVTFIGQDIDVFYFAVFHIRQGKEIAMNKMGRKF